MSNISTVKLPYIQGTVPGKEEKDDVFPLEPNHAYKVGLDYRYDPTVYSNHTKGVPPSVPEASQLDHNVNAVPYGWHKDTVLTLVTQHGKVDLPPDSHFITDAKKKVIWPDTEAPSCDLEASPSFYLATQASDQQ